MTSYVTRRNRGPSLLDATYAILKKDEAKAKKAAKEPAPEPVNVTPKKKPAAKKGARK